MIEQAIREGLQRLGVAAVRRTLPALETVGQERPYTSCFLCYALHGHDVQGGSKEHMEVLRLAHSLGHSGMMISGLHFGGSVIQAQMLRDEVTLFLAEHGDAPEPHIAPESAHAI